MIEDQGTQGYGVSELSEKVGVIVGAASGIGRAVADRLAPLTSNLLLIDLDPQVSEIAARLGCRGLVQDVGRDDVGDAVARAVEDELEGLDFLINCAGVQRRGSLLELSESDWQDLERTNWLGARRMALTAARIMIANGRSGSIVHVTSSSVHTVTHGIIPYSVTKSALEQLTRGLAAELGPHGIRVNAVAPGYVRTAMTRDILDDPNFVERLRPRIPLGYVAEPDEVAAVAAFLISDDARYITGAVIPVDGGFTLGALIVD